MVLSSVERISFLRVLLILHIFICLPLCWLAGNCGDLAEHGFGVADMPGVVDLLDEAYNKIFEDRSKLSYKDFMMSISSCSMNT